MDGESVGGFDGVGVVRRGGGFLLLKCVRFFGDSVCTVSIKHQLGLDPGLF